MKSMKLGKLVELSGPFMLLLLWPVKLVYSTSNILNLDAKHKDIAVAESADDADFTSDNNNNRSYSDNNGNIGRSGPTAVTDIHSRAKRFISFPVGSSFSTAVCLTTGVIGNPHVDYLSMGLNWGIAYDLPNTTWVLEHAKGFGNKDDSGAQIKRRHRRDLYGKLETLISGMGYNGRDCILRALCESRLYFQNTKMGMIGEMLRSIFSLPRQRVYRREVAESPDATIYDRAYRRPRSTGSEDDCSTQYDCGFSLLELAFGKYSRPPPGYYEQH